MNNYSLRHKNETKFFREKEEGNVSCGLKLFLYKNGKFDVLNDAKTINETKKTFETFQNISEFKNEFTALHIPNYIDVGEKSQDNIETTKCEDSFSLDVFDNDQIAPKITQIPDLNKPSQMIKSSSIYEILDEDKKTTEKQQIEINDNSNMKVYSHFIIFQEVVTIFCDDEPINEYGWPLCQLEIINKKYDYYLKVSVGNEVIVDFLVHKDMIFQNVHTLVQIKKMPILDSTGIIYTNARIKFTSMARSLLFTAILYRIVSVLNPYHKLNHSNKKFIFSCPVVEIITNENNFENYSLTKLNMREIVELTEEDGTEFILSVLRTRADHEIKVDLRKDLIELKGAIITWNNCRLNFLKDENYAEVIYNKLFYLGKPRKNTQEIFCCMCVARENNLNLNTDYFGKLFIEKKKTFNTIKFQTSNFDTVYEEIYRPNDLSWYINRNLSFIKYKNRTLHLKFLDNSDKDIFFDALQIIKAQNYF